MKRRDFCKSSMMAAGLVFGGTKLPAAENPVVDFPKAPGLTRYVSEFIVNTRYEDIPADVMALGKKSMLDGFGLALAGSVSTLAPLMKEYIQSLGLCAGKSSMIGTAQKLPPRFRRLRQWKLHPRRRLRRHPARRRQRPRLRIAHASHRSRAAAGVRDL